MNAHELAKMLMEFDNVPVLIFDPDSMQWEEVTGSVTTDVAVRLYSDDIS